MADTIIPCDVGWIGRADIHVVDALARLQFAARRRGCRLLLRNAPLELDELVELMGLAEVLVVEPRREAEQREQRLGVEEERELDEPPA
jgi:ABC-type transporter Mla MlaB component